MIISYNREAAVSYAHQWAFNRNPVYYNYEEIGGDCTNFVSQCIFSGSGIMNYTPVFGWYYINANEKSPSWTGVPFLFDYLTRTFSGNLSPGPLAVPCGIGETQPGDVVQLSANGEQFYHTAIIVSTGRLKTVLTVKVAAHSYDADNKSLASYRNVAFRFLHITGVLTE